MRNPEVPMHRALAALATNMTAIRLP